MSVNVVEILKVIHVDDQERKRRSITLGSLDFLEESIFQIAAVWKSRKRVGQRHPLICLSPAMPLGPGNDQRQMRGHQIEHPQVFFPKRDPLPAGGQIFPPTFSLSA